MQTFLDNARIQLNDNGLYFFEDDFLISKYLFSGDLRIDAEVTFERSGFGIAVFMQQDGMSSYEESLHRYVMLLGEDSIYNCYKHLNSDWYIPGNPNGTHVLKPGIGMKYNIRFQKKDSTISILYLPNDADEYILQGSYTLDRSVQKYYVGLYSSAGNTVKDVSFLQPVPERWHTSISNTHGGRISFWKNTSTIKTGSHPGFMFEECHYDAELEQRELFLSRGTYYLKYETEPVNDIYDIRGYVYPAYITETPTHDTTDQWYESRRATFDEHWLEDEGELLVQADSSPTVSSSVTVGPTHTGKSLIYDSDTGKFQLFADSYVICNFKGKSGRVYDVRITKYSHGGFVETRDKAVVIDGSWITVILDRLQAVKWTGIIYAIPVWSDRAEDIEYGVVQTISEIVPLSPLDIMLNMEYDYYFDVATSNLSVKRHSEINAEAYETIVRNIPLVPEDNNRIKLFVNMDADMELTLIYKDGTEINVGAQRSNKMFVPANIKGPIIVTSESGQSFELCAHYREVLDSTSYKIDIFNRHATELRLSHHTSQVTGEIEVFGLPAGVQVNKAASTIQEFATKYVPLDIKEHNIEFNNDVLTVPFSLRETYPYIAVRYVTMDDYHYWFTLFNREIFLGSESQISLEKIPPSNGEDVTVYGIPRGCFHKNYIRRVPNKNMLDSVDLCANRYTMISHRDFDVENNVITFHTDVQNLYEYFIVEYTQNHTYTVNWNNDDGVYEVDVQINEEDPDEQCFVHYEMDSEGNSTQKIRTEIKANKNKFIVLQRRQGIDYGD